MAGRDRGKRLEMKKNVKAEDYYHLKEELGKGKFGVVYRCEEKTTGKTWAAKYVKTIMAKDREAVKREVELMGELDHPALMALVEVFQTTRQTVLILECITGGELFERIVDDKFDLTESEVISYMRQICAGAQHMHHNLVMHLDLKPENIMCVDRTGFQLKIIDFGLARKYEKGSDVKVMCGTPEFVAPEVISYDAIAPPTDMWSVGVICYVLLSGLSPFLGDSDSETLNNVTVGEWDFEDEAFDEISDTAKDFIKCLLVKDMNKRMTADECFRHPWLSEISTRTKACETKLSTARLKKFLARRRWQRTANAVRAIGRMNALRLVSQRKSKSNGSTSSEKSPTSPTPSSPASPGTQPGEREDPPRGEKRVPTGEEKARIDTSIDQGENATTTESGIKSTNYRGQTVSEARNAIAKSKSGDNENLTRPAVAETNGRVVSVSLDSDVENDSGLDLSLDQNGPGKQSRSTSQRSSQDSIVEGREGTPLVNSDTATGRKVNGVGAEADCGITVQGRDKDALLLPNSVIDTNSVTSSLADKSDLSVCSDASEDTAGSSDQGVNMERYLFDPSRGVKNQAAKWEVRQNSPDRKGNRGRAGSDRSSSSGGGGSGSGGGRQSPPQQAPVFRQKFRHCEVGVGTEARFECRVDGHPTPDIIWYKNGKRMQEGDRHTIRKEGDDLHLLVVKAVTKDDQGTYMCEARSPAGKARCSARLVVQQHPVPSSNDVNSSPTAAENSKVSLSSRSNSTSRKFWQFGLSKSNKDQREKSATPPSVKSPTSAGAPATKQSFFSLSLDRKGSARAEQQRTSANATPPASQAQASPKSAVDKLKQRAEAFTAEYEKRKQERESLADRQPRRSANISAYLSRYTRSASADRSSSFSIGSTSGRRSSEASTGDDTDFAPQTRPRLATYATMIRSPQSIGALAARFEQNKPNGKDNTPKGGSSTLPRKDLKYNANLDAKKALFSSSSNGTTNSKSKEPISLTPRSTVRTTPSTSSIRSKFESPSKSDKDSASASFARTTPVRQSTGMTGRGSYLDKIESKEKTTSSLTPSSSSAFTRTSPARHSTIGITSKSTIDSKYSSKDSITNTRKEPSRPASTFSSSVMSVKPSPPSSSSSSTSSRNQPTFISRFETVVNSDSESSVASSTSSSISDRKSRTTPPTSSSISSRYELKSPVVEKPPSFVKKPAKLTSTEGESATFSCVVEGEPKPTVTWSFRGKPLADEGRVELYEEKGQHFLEIFDLEPRDAGLYTCRIVNSAGRSSALVELTVNTQPKRPPFFLQKLSDCEVHEAGANGRLQCKLDGAPAPEVTWLREGKVLRESDRVHFTRQGSSIHALIIDDVTEDDDAIYTCVASNKHGQVSSSAELIVEIDPMPKSEMDSLATDTSLHIDEDDIQASPSSLNKPAATSSPSTTEPPPTATARAPPKFLVRPNSVTADESKSARFTCSVTGYPPPTVTWAKDETVMRDEGRFEIYDEEGEFVMEIFDIVPEDEGLYTVAAVNSEGKAATGAQLMVNRTKKEKKMPPKPAVYNSMSSTDVRTEDVFSSEDVSSLRSEQIVPTVHAPVAAAAPAVRKTSVPAFEPPSRIPPEFLARPSAQTVVEPNSAKFSCRVVGDPKPTVTWSRNGVVLSDSGRLEIYEEKDDFILEIFDTTPSDSGTYVCTATNLAGQKTADASLNVESSAPKGIPPEFLDQIAATTVKDGDSAKFVCKVTGLPPPTVQWFYRNQEIVGSDEVYELYHEGETASLCLPEVLPEDEGEYSCKIRNEHGEATCTAILNVQVTPALSNNETETDNAASSASKIMKPEFVQKLKDIQAIDGSPLSLPVRIKGEPEPEVKWYFSNELIKEDDDFKFVRDGDRFSLVIAEVYPDDAGIYTCKISNAVGAAECACKVFVQENDVDGSPPKFLQKPRSINIDEGSSVTLSCKIDGEPLPTVTWIKDGRPIEPGRRFKMESSGISGTTRSLNIPTVLATDAGSYTCALQNAHGMEQCSVTVVVKPLEEEQTDFRSLLKSRPRLQNISNSPNNISSDKSEAEQVDFRHVLTRHVTTRKRPVFAKSLADVEVTEGESVTFECYVDGIPDPAIVWTANKKEIKESKYFHMSFIDNVAKLVIAEAFPEDEGDYTCTATNAAGSVSSTAELTVLDEEEDLNGPRLAIDEPTVKIPKDDTPRSVIESDCTHDKVASTFNVRLSKVLNGTAPSSPDQVQHNTNSNNNKEVIAQPPTPALAADDTVVKSSARAEESVSESESVPSAPASSSSASQDTELVVEEDSAAVVIENGESSPSAMAPPSFVEPLKEVSVLEESSAMFKCSVTGEPEPDITWYKDGVQLKSDRKYKLDFPDDDVAVLIVKETELEDAGVYTCKAINPWGTVDSTAELIVEAPARIKNAPRTLQVTAGSDLTVTCQFVAVPEPDVVWSKNRKTVQEDDRVSIDDTDTATTLTIVKATHADGGRYSLLVENDLGSDEATMYVTVLDKPDPPVGKPIASNITRESLTLTWTGSSYDGGSRVTGYVVEMRTAEDGDDAWKKVDVVPHTSHTIEKLRPETKFLFRVSSQNEYGVSDPGQASDPIETVVVLVEQKKKQESKTDSENDGEGVEFRHVTIKPDKQFSEKYAIKEVLGKGRFGTVHKCVDKETGKEYAAKMIKTIKSSDKESVKNEIDVMNKLHHGKLLQCLDAFESPKQMIMVLEIVNGGELFERVIDDDFGLTERDVIEFMRQICAGVQHMHRQNILHLDLKPENILCMDKTGSKIKLIDFGLARNFDPKQNVKVMFGTPEFVAPEVINYDTIGYTTDMWSVGVICYILLSGLSPFMGDNDAETLSNVTLAEWDFEDEAFDTLSEDAKTFIEGLLIREREERMTADDCLKHKWLVTKQSKTNKISTAKLKNFVARRRWQSGSNESDSDYSDRQETEEEKTATAVRAIGRMASLSLLGGAKKSEGPNLMRSLTSPKEKMSEAPSTPKITEDDVTPTLNTAINETRSSEKSPKPVVEESVGQRLREKVESGPRSNGIQDEKRDVTLDEEVKNRKNTDAKIEKDAKVDDAEDESEEEVDEDEDEDVVDGPGKTDLNQNIPGAPHFIKEMVDSEVFEGDSARFDCKVAGDPEPDIKWFQDGVEIEESARFIFDCDDDGSFSLIIRRIQEDDEGEYSIKATNSKGEAICVADLLVDGF